jgi:hypothetical protein
LTAMNPLNNFDYSTMNGIVSQPIYRHNIRMTLLRNGGRLC